MIFLILVMAILLLKIDKLRGSKTLISFFLNIFLLLLFTFFIAKGYNIDLLTILFSFALISVIIFFTNGYNKKTISALISVLIIIGFLMIFLKFYLNGTYIHGFGDESFEDIFPYSFNIDLSMFKVFVASVIIGLLGTISDTAIAVSSVIYELYQNNKKLSFKDLFTSGIKVGNDIIVTTVNTIYFVFLASLFSLFIWLFHHKISFAQFINNKIIAADIINMLMLCCASLLVIPITSYISAKIIKKK